MSRYLERIIGRAREELEVVEPVLASRYEEGPREPGAGEIETFVEAPVRRAKTARLPEAEPVPAVRADRAREAAPDRKPAATPAPVLHAEPVRRVAAPAEESGSPGPQQDAVAHTLAAPAPEARQAPEPGAAEPVRPVREMEQEAAPEPPPAAEGLVEERIVEVSGRERIRVETLEWERAVERLAPPAPASPAAIVTRRTAEPVERAPRAEREQHEAAAAPEVRVHIGRIEITAPAAAPPPAPARRARFEPELNLAAYLEERRRPRS